MPSGKAVAIGDRGCAMCCARRNLKKRALSGPDVVFVHRNFNRINRHIE
jgi:hypothetical protein